ncbi:trichohyalin-like [Venturia canescens]|uniref:trichohyalin-like n=1 Tax=Venturia canescens TaxID=32260 RepID=UPI001C9D5695|nr:trichohyalin-like [Venturia canescens]
MAHDSDIDGWQLRQLDLASRDFDRTGKTTRTIRTRGNHDFQEYETPTNARENDSFHFPPRTRLTRSGPAVRSHDSTRCPGTFEPNKFAAPRSIIEANCGDFEVLNGHLSSLSITEKPKHYNRSRDRHDGHYTYRCQPLASPPTPSTLLSSRANSKSSVRVVSCTIGDPRSFGDSNGPGEQPEIQRYALNGTKVVEFSASSTNLSGNETSRSQMSQAKKRAWEEWVKRKRAEELRRKEEVRKLELEQQEEENRLVKEREERERRERESFLQWNERKRKEEASKRENMERELEFERRLKEVEDKAIVAKTIYLRQWARKKEEQQKALQRKQELRKKRDEEERKRRLEASQKAYVKWKEISKNRPKPATQGLLPHQKAKPSYINPNPWVADDVEPEETTKKQSLEEIKKTLITATKSDSKKSILSKS